MRFKRIIAIIILSAILFASPNGIVSASQLSDIGQHWGKGYIEALTNTGIISGYPDGTFRPDNPITRAEFCKIIMKALENEGDISLVSPSGLFDDVSTDKWYAAYVETAAANNFVSGKGTRVFDPEALITRQEMAKIISLVYCWKNDLNLSSIAAGTDLNEYNLDDLSYSSPWAVDFIKVSLKTGLMKGKVGSFSPLGLVTRAETATVTCRILGITPPSDETGYSYDFPLSPGNLITITLIANDPSSLGSTENQEYVKLFEDHFNVKFNLVDTATLDTLDSDQMPDIIPANLGSTFYENLKDNGLIRNIPQYLLDKYPKINAMVNKHDATTAFKNIAGGKLYDIPRYEAYPTYRNYDTASFAVRKDWMNKVGINIDPNAKYTTIGQFGDILNKFTNNDPDGNGNKDTWGIAGNLQAGYFTPWTGTGLMDWVKDTDGVYRPTYASQRMLDPLKYYTTQLGNGYIFPNFWQAPFSADRVFGFSQNYFNVGYSPYLAGMMSVNSDEAGLYESLSAGFKSKNTYQESGSDIIEPTPPTTSTRTPAPTRTPIPTRYNPTPTPIPTPTPTLAPTSKPTVPEDFAFQNDSVPIGDVVELLPPLKVSDSDPQAKVPAVIPTDVTTFNVNVSDEKLDRILMIYDYILNGKGSDIVTYGIYDNDWFVYDGKAHTVPNTYAWDLYTCQDIFTYASFKPKAYTPSYILRDPSLAVMTQKQDLMFGDAAIIINDDDRVKSIMANAIANEAIHSFIDPAAEAYNEAVVEYDAGGTAQALAQAIDVYNNSPDKANYDKQVLEFTYGLCMDYQDAVNILYNTKFDKGMTNSSDDEFITAHPQYKYLVDNITLLKAQVDQRRQELDQIYSSLHANIDKAKKDDDAAKVPVKSALAAVNITAPYKKLLTDSAVLVQLSNVVSKAKSANGVSVQFKSMVTDPLSPISYNKTTRLQDVIDLVNQRISQSKYFK